MNISKNSKIKPHVDVSDKEASIIRWINSGNIEGGDFVVHKLWYKFYSSNDAGIFLRLIILVHGILKSISPKMKLYKNFKLEATLVNKKKEFALD